METTAASAAKEVEKTYLGLYCDVEPGRPQLLQAADRETLEAGNDKHSGVRYLGHGPSARLVS